MPKIQFQPEVIKTLLSQFKTAELENFIQIISTILSNRKKKNRKEKEAELLIKINQCVLSEEHLEQFLYLRNKRKEKELPSKELSVFFSLINEEQELQVKRIKILKKLADLKEIGVPILMKQLEITAPPLVSKTISKKNKQRVAERVNRLYEYCLAPANYAFHPFCIDHIIPISKGGNNILINLAYSCQNCNAKKYNKTEGIDPLSRLAIKLFNPRINSWNKHFLWNEKGTVIIGVSSCGRTTIETLKMNLPSVINIREALVLIGVHPPIVK